MKRALVAAPFAAFLLWASLPLSAALLPTSVDAGDSLSVTCPTRLTHVYSNQRREVTLTCSPATASPAPSTTATLTPATTAATPTLAPTPTPQPTASPSPVATATSTTPTPSPTNPPPSTSCNSYPEPRIFLETQDHWSPIPELGTLGHVHIGMCFPLGQTVSGDVDFDIRVIMYENKGELIRVKGQDDASRNFYLNQPNITPPDGGERIFWFHTTVDTTRMADGIRHFRWYADVLHANGNTQTARANWPLDIENGTTDRNAANSVRYLNWYQVENPKRNWGYIGPTVDAIPLTPVDQSLTLNVKCALNGDSNSPAIDRSIVNLDAAFHQGSDGTIVYNGAPLNGNLTVNTSGLSEGAHRLSIRCIQEDGDETHEGIGIVPFTVEH